MFNRKRVLFIGPQGNPTKEFMKSYDYVIRTNGFFGIKRNYLHSYRCDVLITNGTYVFASSDTIIKNINKLKKIYTTNLVAHRFLEKRLKSEDHQKIEFVKYDRPLMKKKIKKKPFLLTLLLFHIIKYHKPKLLYITGIDFYQSKRLNKIWAPGYVINHELKSNSIAKTNISHDIRSNIIFFRECLRTYKWLKCDRNIIKIVNDYLSDKEKKYNMMLDYLNSIDYIKKYNRVIDKKKFIDGLDRNILSQLNQIYSLRDKRVLNYGVGNTILGKHLINKYDISKYKTISNLKNGSNKIDVTKMIEIKEIKGEEYDILISLRFNY